MNAAVSALAARRLGRFELQRELGRGAQATVWLAWDERLEREVAVKLLDVGSDSADAREWLHEARAVSRLNHPNIVPVFEAHEGQDRPYLVFEYVPGPTLALAQRTRQPRAREAREAVQLMLGILDALAAAHAQGLVHRDLKPSNVLLGEDGRPRVMDFGIAARVAQGDGRIVGTPGYISPEAAQGAAPSPAMDVFAAGVMLAELLAGMPMVRERDPWAALRRVVEADLVLPAEAGIEPALAAIAQRAMARDPAARYASASSLREALIEWLKPQALTQGESAAGESAAANPTLEFLLRRMRVKSDFPALGDAVLRVQRLANSERESVSALAEEILQDVALTNKLLRQVNSAHFAQSASGGVSTVSRAIALMGFAGVRNLALSLVLLDQMQDKQHAQQLKRDFVQSLMAGQIADALSDSARESEPSFIVAMFQNLGRLLASFYFPEEAEAIRRLCTPTALPGSNLAPPPDEATAARQVLGTSFDELGQGVAKAWGLPEGLRVAMRQPGGEIAVRALPRGPERQRWVAALANAAAQAIGQGAPEQLAARLELLSERYATALEIPARSLKQAVTSSQEKVRPLALAMGLPMAKVDPSAVVAAPAMPLGSAAPVHGRGPGSGTPPPSAAVPVPVHEPGSPLAAAAAAAADADAKTILLPPRQNPKPAAAPEVAAVVQALSSGIQDVTRSLMDERFKLNEVLQMVMETMWRALEFKRVVFCLRDPRSGALTGRLGLGEGAQALAPKFQIVLKPPAGQLPDLFAAVCLKQADTLISDARAGGVASRLPAWYVERVNGSAFLLLPMRHRDAPLGLLYADTDLPGLRLEEQQLNLLRTLRDQAVMAFRQAQR
jgi:eukaryotic-like serine/threonine-protein kinase